MKKFKKYILITLTIFICMCFNSNIILASDTVKDMGSKTITDVNKVWTVSFKAEVDIISLSGNVQITDVTTGSTFTPSISQGNDNYTIKINPPSSGYTKGHEYKLILNKFIKSQKGNNLPQTTIMTFSIEDNDSVSYDVSADVVVSPYLSVFKQITLTSQQLPEGTKFKVEGNDNIFNIGDTVRSIIGTSTVDIHFYSSDGNTEIGTGTLDVSTTNDSLNMEVTH